MNAKYLRTWAKAPRHAGTGSQIQLAVDGAGRCLRAAGPAPSRLWNLRLTLPLDLPAYTQQRQGMEEQAEGQIPPGGQVLP